MDIEQLKKDMKIRLTDNMKDVKGTEITKATHMIRDIATSNLQDIADEYGLLEGPIQVDQDINNHIEVTSAENKKDESVELSYKPLTDEGRRIVNLMLKSMQGEPSVTIAIDKDEIDD